MRRWPKCERLTIRNRLFTQSDLVAIRKLIRDHPSWGRTKLSEKICQLFDWVQPNGRLKDRACRVALLKLEELGFLQLPPKRIENGGKPPRISERNLDIGALSRMPEDLNIRLVTQRNDAAIWNAIVDKYHYLGLATPVGRLLRYLILGDGMLLGAIAISECAWNVSVRNTALREIGINNESVHNVVISNSRFLILPTVSVPNLASRSLSACTQRVARDWYESFSCWPRVVETFVDPTRYHGTCYRAANWVFVGMTKGYAKRGSTHAEHRTPKMVMLRGLTRRLQGKLARCCVQPTQTSKAA